MQVEFMQVAEKCMAVYNVQTLCVKPPFDDLDRFDYGLRKTLDPQFDWMDFGRQLLREVPPDTLVFAEGIFELRFAFFRLPDQTDALLSVGPWRSGPRSAKTMRWVEENMLPGSMRVLEEYNNAVPDLTGRLILAQLRALAELAYSGKEVNVVFWHEFMPLNFRDDLRFFNEPDFKMDLPATLIEQRYAGENRMLDAVTLGDTKAALDAMSQLKRFKLGARGAGTLRDSQNIAIVLNTLLRKSIERANVHPYYIDRISERYARQIVTVTSVEELTRIQLDMVAEYCAYVKRYSLRAYSPMVQKVINHINLHLDSQLSLKNLAALCYISPSYLSNLFKQETGQTLTDYINTQRIHRAARRLCTTQEGISAVAVGVGILDVNYFTKMFKKTMGVTPTQYRKEHRGR